MRKKTGAMSETAFYILLSLMEERHGYGIMKYVSRLTDKRVRLGAGTVYGTLGKLECSGLIAITGEEDKRKYYRITDAGKARLCDELGRLKELYENGKTAFENDKENREDAQSIKGNHIR